MKNIIVIFGGQSIEHDVSIITGVLTVNSIDKEKYNAIPIYVHTNGKAYTGIELLDLDNYTKLNFEKLKKVEFLLASNALYINKKGKLKENCRISCCINCIHGERGEDGCISALMKMCNIPIASPDILSSAITMDKIFTKHILKTLKIKTLPYIFLSRGESISPSKLNINFPLIVKPATAGSSIGISKVNDFLEVKSAIINAFKFSDKVIIEPCIKDFIEINCAGYKNSQNKIVVSLCEKPIGKQQILTFDDKYKNGSREFPANIRVSLAEKIRKTTAIIYDKLNLNGIVRIDYFIYKDEVYVNEINSVPGSLAYYLFCDTLSEFTTLLTDLITEALQRGAKNSQQITHFNSGILTGWGSKGSKHLKKNK